MPVEVARRDVLGDLGLTFLSLGFSSSFAETSKLVIEEEQDPVLALQKRYQISSYQKAEELNGHINSIAWKYFLLAGILATQYSQSNIGVKKARKVLIQYSPEIIPNEAVRKQSHSLFNIATFACFSYLPALIAITLTDIDALAEKYGIQPGDKIFFEREINRTINKSFVSGSLLASIAAETGIHLHNPKVPEFQPVI